MLMFVFILQLFSSALTADECSYMFTHQPPAQLTCSPLQSVIRLQCASSSPEDIIVWLWSRSKEQAGMNGTIIMSNLHQKLYTLAQHVHHLTITVTPSTLGYYWCEISNSMNVTLKPTTVTPVCPQDHCLPPCTEQLVSNLHSRVLTCAETDRVIPPSLPDCNSSTKFTQTQCSSIVIAPHTTLAAFVSLLDTTSVAMQPSPSSTISPTIPPVFFNDFWIIVIIIVLLSVISTCLAGTVSLYCYIYKKQKSIKPMRNSSNSSWKGRCQYFQHTVKAPILLEEGKKWSVLIKQNY